MCIKNDIENANLSIPKDKIKYEEPMNLHTSFKVGGPAEVFVIVQNEGELKQIYEFAKEKNIDIAFIGNGSNLLVKDEGYKGIVVKIDINKIEIEEYKKDILVTVGAGNKIGELSYVFAKQGISGFEEISGVPGTIGGAIKMNAGANGKEMKDIVENIRVMDENGNIKNMSNKEAEFCYRDSVFSRNKCIILEAVLKLKKGNKEEILKKMKEYAKIRKEKQPLEYPSAGSTFKRGENYITAKLIDEAGLKGYQIGGAQISEKHAGFIVNKGEATAKDILDLIEYTEQIVYKKFGVHIQMEVELL